MVYIVAAFYWEAHMIIEAYGLKKVLESTHFQQFYSKEAGMCLTISGAGEIAAAAAVSSMCTQYQPGAGDMLLNIGICAGMGGQEGVFVVHKLTEQATGKTFYPDMLYRCPFPEASLMTGMAPQVGVGPQAGVLQRSRALGAVELPGRQEEAQRARGYRGLYDMEAAAVYQAGAYYFGPHQMVFIKVVSDNGGADAKDIAGHQVEQLFAKYKGSILGHIRFLQSVQKSLYRQGKGDLRIGRSAQGDKKQERIQALCADMHCSKAMKDGLLEYIRYLELAGIDYEAAIQRMYDEKKLPCKDKREGKKCFAQLKEYLL